MLLRTFLLLLLQQLLLLIIRIIIVIRTTRLLQSHQVTCLGRPGPGLVHVCKDCWRCEESWCQQYHHVVQPIWAPYRVGPGNSQVLLETRCSASVCSSSTLLGFYFQFGIEAFSCPCMSEPWCPAVVVAKRTMHALSSKFNPNPPTPLCYNLYYSNKTFLINVHTPMSKNPTILFRATRVRTRIATPTITGIGIIYNSKYWQ